MMLTRSPKAAPARPRVSSATSGFFFWGIMLLPVEYASAISKKPNSGEDQYTSSSHKDERCTAVRAAAKRYSATKSRSDTPSMELAHGASKPSSCAVYVLSILYVVPARAADPRGQMLRRL
ncbi:MAG: hypothetical protein A4E31_01181 [Methanomassiliicoccales archaeon PtaU1.Bin030]|nr:MAG: hypothetical protein A4E31_01181 [Methanomassiliicoccales archaeon PtaU1.Bin030]